MKKIKENNVVKKQNVLNELRSNNMTLQELRFFSIYLSKIDLNDTSTRVVRFSVEDFRHIMDLGRININYLKSVTGNILTKLVSIDTKSGGYNQFQLFKECIVDMDNNSEWFIEIDAHDKALPLMFEFKNKYFTYELWNALRLKSSNQLRMYEILKQYEKIGYRIISVEDLKEYLGISKEEYSRFNNLKKWVLDACQKTLEEKTDIKFTFEPCGKKGVGGKISHLKFIIEKNKDFIDQLTLDEFIDLKKEKTLTEEIGEKSIYEERIDFMRGACENIFTEKEMAVILDILKTSLDNDFYDDVLCYNFLESSYNILNLHAERKEIKDKFAYFKKIIDIKE